MNHNKSYIFFVIILFLFTTHVFSGDAGKNGFALLKMEVDARAAAMGGAYTAVAEDASAAFWNPAGLAGSSAKSFIFMHYNWIADLSQEFASAHLLTGKHNIAFSANLLTMKDIEIRDMASDEPYGTTEWIVFSGMMSYAAYLIDDIAVGINLKYLFEKLYLEKASGWAVDFGAKKKNVITGLDLGLTIQNIGQMSKLRKESTPLPLMVTTGIGYNLPVELLGKQPLIAADVQYVNDESVYYHIGSQIDLYKYVTLRLGWIVGDNKNQPTMGVGLNYSRFHFDYSYSMTQYDLDGNQRISLGFQF
ncbi:MAG TPA: PorV/PorQ family protein [Caldithrix sp.]|nr:PorV/PorQ family protein [Calditrichaceae bacterium]HEM49488.1 PorV/PorQ family protein [Caldithrix sp.]